jgi:hypothetical protein
MICSEELSAAAGILLSLSLSYIPGLSAWFGELPAERKRLVMLGLLVVATGGIVGLACGGLAAELGLAVSCDKPGMLQILRAFVLAVIANQATFAITPRPVRVKRSIFYTGRHSR